MKEPCSPWQLAEPSKLWKPAWSPGHLAEVRAEQTAGGRPAGSLASTVDSGFISCGAIPPWGSQLEIVQRDSSEKYHGVLWLRWEQGQKRLIDSKRRGYDFMWL